MAVRIRTSGEIICAAKSQPEPNDIYIDDFLHYRLAVLERVLIPDAGEMENGIWHWRSEVYPPVVSPGWSAAFKTTEPFRILQPVYYTGDDSVTYIPNGTKPIGLSCRDVGSERVIVSSL